MAATATRAKPREAAGNSHSGGRVAFLLIAPVGVAGAVVGVVHGRDSGLDGHLGWVSLTLVWAIAGVVLLRRSGYERLGKLASWFSLLTGAAALAAGVARGDASALVLALVIALLPAAMLHVLLALPTGVLSRDRAPAVIAGYLVGAGVGVFLWTERPSLPAWPVVIEAAVAAGVGVNGVVTRYRLAPRAERQQMR
ncbi:MAG TPA: hypothetical protein VKB43_09995, partial [Gaiellaceae bacterium]|nr:hypothetical protein [Gaiellaceae bacterium]